MLLDKIVAHKNYLGQLETTDENQGVDRVTRLFFPFGCKSCLFIWNYDETSDFFCVYFGGRDGQSLHEQARLNGLRNYGHRLHLEQDGFSGLIGGEGWAVVLHINQHESCKESHSCDSKRYLYNQFIKGKGSRFVHAEHVQPWHTAKNVTLSSNQQECI